MRLHTICADRALQLHREVANVRRAAMASGIGWTWCAATDDVAEGAVLLVRASGGWASHEADHLVIHVASGDSSLGSAAPGSLVVDRGVLTLEFIQETLTAWGTQRSNRARGGVAAADSESGGRRDEKTRDEPAIRSDDVTEVLDSFVRSSFPDTDIRPTVEPAPDAPFEPVNVARDESEGSDIVGSDTVPVRIEGTLPGRDAFFTPWSARSLSSDASDSGHPADVHARSGVGLNRTDESGSHFGVSRNGDVGDRTALSVQSELAQRILGVVGEAMGTLGADPVRNVKRLLQMALTALSAAHVRFDHTEGWSLVADHNAGSDSSVDWDAVSSLVQFEHHAQPTADDSGSLVSWMVVNAGLHFGDLRVRLSPGHQLTEYVHFVVVLTSTSIALELARQRVEHASELRYRMVDTLLEASTVAVGLVSAIGTPDRVNSAWTALAEGMGWTVATLARRAGPGLVGWDRVLAGAPDTNELTWAHYRLEVARRPIAQPDGRTGVVITLNDLTDLAAEQQRLRREARRDSLTALPNRRSLNDWLDARTNERAVVELCILDLDDFKSVNERWGHNSGDLVLRVVGQRLSRFLHQRCIVARLGGDEFVVARTAQDETSGQLGEEILDALKDPIPVNGGQRSIGVSVGSATGYASGDLMRRADAALFEAKRRGKRCHVFRKWSATAETAALVTRTELEAALQDGDIGVAVQPIYETETNEVVSVELLARWTHAEHGFISPDVFVELAENSGLICQLTEYMIRRVPHVLRMVERRWGRTNIRAAVNVSFEDIASDRLVDVVRGITEAGLFAANRLIIEITERSAVEDVDRARETFRQLRDLGVSVALDDFGSGYSSLGVLRRLGVDIVKVDRSFLSHGDNEDSDVEQFFRSVVHFCASLGFDVVAEGVETEEDFELVRQAGAGRAQGYHLGRPEMLELPRITGGLRLPTG